VAELLEVITKQMVCCGPMAETSMLEETCLLNTRTRDALGSKLCELECMTIPAAKCRLEREYSLLVAESYFREDHEEEEQYVTVTEEYFLPDV